MKKVGKKEEKREIQEAEKMEKSREKMRSGERKAKEKRHIGKRAKAASFILILCIGILTFIFIGECLPVHGESEIYDSVVRFHVIANSDEEHDQQLKLMVRDEVLKAVSGELSGCESRYEAKEKIESLLTRIQEVAQDVILREGYEYTVSVSLGEEYYPTRKYESCTFPEGRYLSLRIIIGEGEGKNWWCCLFPPLCLTSSVAKESNEDAFISAGLSSEQYKVITDTDVPKYKIRFKILEVFQKKFG